MRSRMEPESDIELYHQLLGYLAAEGEIVEDETGSVLVTEFGHRVLDQPLRLRLTPSTFGHHLRDEASDSVALYPDVHPVDAAWRLFTIHLDEAVQTARPGETDLVLVRGGVVPRRPDGTRSRSSPEIEHHIALSEYHERLVRYLADRGEVTVQREVLALHSLDGQAFRPPLGIHVAADEMGRQMRAADDAEAAWSAIVRRIDHLVGTADPREVELVLTPDGVVCRRL